MVVIDVAMTETARHADYVLPACSQFEKWEATFFASEFPTNYFSLRAPILDPLPGTLPEAEIHSRLLRAMGALRDDDLAPLREAAAKGRTEFAIAFREVTSANPALGALAPVVLYETLGPTLGKGNEAAAILWGAAQSCAMSYPESVRRAGFEGEGPEVGNRLFDAIFASRSGVAFSVDDYAETWRRVKTSDGRIQLEIPELIGELEALSGRKGGERSAVPLHPGGRRAPLHHRQHGDSRSRMASQGPKRRAADESRRRPGALGVGNGGRVRITTRRGSAEAVVEVTDRLQPGHVTLPNGGGLSYPDEAGRAVTSGVAPNELTASDHRDWIAGTPFHKHVPARIEAVEDRRARGGGAHIGADARGVIEACCSLV